MSCHGCRHRHPTLNPQRFRCAASHTHEVRVWRFSTGHAPGREGEHAEPCPMYASVARQPRWRPGDRTGEP